MKKRMTICPTLLLYGFRWAKVNSAAMKIFKRRENGGTILFRAAQKNSKPTWLAVEWH